MNLRRRFINWLPTREHRSKIDDVSHAPGCQLEEPPFYQCCCRCQYLVEDRSHPHTDGQSMANIRGYICGAPEMGYMMSGWPRHSVGCEMFSDREGK